MMMMMRYVTMKRGLENVNHCGGGDNNKKYVENGFKDNGNHEITCRMSVVVLL